MIRNFVSSSWVTACWRGGLCEDESSQKKKRKQEWFCGFVRKQPWCNVEFQITTLCAAGQESPRKLSGCTLSILISTGACWCFFSFCLFASVSVFLSLYVFLFWNQESRVLFQANFLFTYFFLWLSLFKHAAPCGFPVCLHMHNFGKEYQQLINFLHSSLSQSWDQELQGMQSNAVKNRTLCVLDFFN